MRRLILVTLTVMIVVSGCGSTGAASHSSPVHGTHGRWVDSTVAFDYPEDWHAYTEVGCEASTSVGQTTVCVIPPGARRAWIASQHAWAYDAVAVWTKPSYLPETPFGIRSLAANEQAGIDAAPGRVVLVGSMSVTTHGARPGFSYGVRNSGVIMRISAFFAGGRRYSVTCTWSPADRSLVKEGCARIMSSLRAR
jgi:uncharacterized protein YceK